MSDTVIKIEGLSKRYFLTHQREAGYSTFREEIARVARGSLRALSSALRGARAPGTEPEEFWALDDVSLEVRRGDRVGVIGRNGSGKSTLLKILSRIVEPTRGRIRIRGSVASLLEVGTGFHPELTGRENIYLNGAVLGMSRAEVRRKFDEIVDFSGVEKFLDTPVKRYSSGMYVRLAFAVAAHLEPEILVVDEVLAVGDAEFQKKCIGKMEDVSRKEGRTVLFVSHNMSAVQSLCSRGILLQGGKLASDGGMQECVALYIGSAQSLRTKDLGAIERPTRHCSGEARILAFSFRNSGQDGEVISADKPCTAEISFEVFQDNTTVGAEFIISDDFQKLSLFHSYLRNGLAPVFAKGVHRMTCEIAPLPLTTGSYPVTLGLSRPGVPIDYLENAATIEVALPHRDGMMEEYKRASGNGCVFVEHKWRVG